MAAKKRKKRKGNAVPGSTCTARMPAPARRAPQKLHGLLGPAALGDQHAEHLQRLRLAGWASRIWRYARSASVHRPDRGCNSNVHRLLRYQSASSGQATPRRRRKWSRRIAGARAGRGTAVCTPPQGSSLKEIVCHERTGPAIFAEHYMHKSTCTCAIVSFFFRAADAGQRGASATRDFNSRNHRKLHLPARNADSSRIWAAG